MSSPVSFESSSDVKLVIREGSYVQDFQQSWQGTRWLQVYEEEDGMRMTKRTKIWEYRKAMKKESKVNGAQN